MKILRFIAIAMLLMTTVSTVDAKKTKEIVTATYDATIDCDACAKKIMDTLPFDKGVKSVKVDLPKRQVTVKYDTAKCSDASIISSLKKVDIDAKRQTAK